MHMLVDAPTFHQGHMRVCRVCRACYIIKSRKRQSRPNIEGRLGIHHLEW
jgi:hypothetical protein